MTDARPAEPATDPAAQPPVAPRTGIGGRWWVTALVVVAASLAVVAAFELTTTLINTKRFSWDNVRYLRMAREWFAYETMTSPFAYRWGTPMLARVLSDVLGVSLTTGFRLIAWAGATLQLTSVFYLVLSVSRSVRAAWAGWAVTCLSVWNIRFLMFDPFRPDHLAYPIVILATLAAYRRRWGWLIALTVLGAPIREFTVVPLLAAVVMLAWNREGKTLARWALPFLATLVVAVVLPRMLIPVVKSRQTVDLDTFAGDMARLLTFWTRHLNILLGYVSYAVPALMLFAPARFAEVWRGFGRDLQRYLIAYSVFVFALVFMGGTDIHRFVSYMVVPLALIVGGLAVRASVPELVVATIGTFWFNRLAEPIPNKVVNNYLDFWGGWSGRVNLATAWRFAGAAICVAAGQLTRILTARWPGRRAPG